MSRHGPPRAYSIALRKRRDAQARILRRERIQRDIDSLEGVLRWLDPQLDGKEFVRLKSKIRMLKQRLKYIGEEYTL
jgi:hypothetical protein